MLLALSTLSCAVGAAPGDDDSRRISLTDAYPDVVDKTFIDWYTRKLNNTFMCDPRDVDVEIVDDAGYNRMFPNTCGEFLPNKTIVLPVGAVDIVVEHEVLHWLAGCTGRDPNFDADHKDAELYGPTGITPVSYNCKNTAGR